jgi:hypothetical protein
LNEKDNELSPWIQKTGDCGKTLFFKKLPLHRAMADAPGSVLIAARAVLRSVLCCKAAQKADEKDEGFFMPAERYSDTIVV